ncbi:MAG: putative DNA-binding domain-containing protein, partial [Acidobacteriota bacterium]|nr:putative DNA-binding domain-containing protein [Acidobacteriota bacterium]
MKLLESQRVIAAALMQPWNPRGRTALAAAGLIKPNSRLSAAERLEIYSRSYWCRLMDSLREDFPGLEAILGHAAFDRAAAAYLADCPSTSFTLRDLGSRLESWLRAHRRYAGRNPALATDMAQLEWAHIVAFDGPADAILQPR